MRAVLAFVLACSGCASAISAARPLSPARERELNDRMDGHKGSIQFSEGSEVVVAKDLRLSGETVQYREKDPAKSTLVLTAWLPEATTAALASVRQIKVRSPGRGAAHGFFIGAPIGMLVGGALGAVLGGIQENKRDQPDWLLVGGGVGGLVAGFLGLAIGGVVGAPTTIDFQK